MTPLPKQCTEYLITWVTSWCRTFYALPISPRAALWFNEASTTLSGRFRCKCYLKLQTLSANEAKENRQKSEFLWRYNRRWRSIILLSNAGSIKGFISFQWQNGIIRLQLVDLRRSSFCNNAHH